MHFVKWNVYTLSIYYVGIINSMYGPGNVDVNPL